jgi:hypothetical protein
VEVLGAGHGGQLIGQEPVAVLAQFGRRIGAAGEALSYRPRRRATVAITPSAANVTPPTVPMAVGAGSPPPPITKVMRHTAVMATTLTADTAHTITRSRCADSWAGWLGPGSLLTNVRLPSVLNRYRQMTGSDVVAPWLHPGGRVLLRLLTPVP